MNGLAFEGFTSVLLLNGAVPIIGFVFVSVVPAFEVFVGNTVVLALDGIDDMGVDNGFVKTDGNVDDADVEKIEEAGVGVDEDGCVVAALGTAVCTCDMVG